MKKSVFFFNDHSCMYFHFVLNIVLDKVMKKMCDCLSSSLQDNHNKCFCGLSVRHLMSALEHFLKDSKNFQKVILFEKTNKQRKKKPSNKTASK